MTWKAKAHPTQAEVAHAHALLAPDVWHMGIIETDGHIQYRGALHPNYDGPGTHRGVEVWTDIPNDQYGAKQVVTDEQKQVVFDAVMGCGFPQNEVNAWIQIESGWNPHSVNKSTNAGGLIGFMPFILKKLGWNDTPEAFRAQSIDEQAPWVRKYLELVGCGAWRVPGDTYLAGAASGFVGAPDSTIVYPRGSKAWEQNKGWRPADNGDITAGSIRAVVLKKMASMGLEVENPGNTVQIPEVTITGDANSWGGPFWLGCLLLFGGAVMVRRKIR